MQARSGPRPLCCTDGSVRPAKPGAPRKVVPLTVPGGGEIREPCSPVNSGRGRACALCPVSKLIPSPGASKRERQDEEEADLGSEADLKASASRDGRSRRRPDRVPTG